MQSINRTLLICIFISLLVPFSADSIQRTAALEVLPGDSYSRLHWFGVFPKKLKPQMAAWIEDSRGNLVQTLFMSSRNGEESWIGGVPRPEALSVFSGRHYGTDTVSSATPGEKEVSALDSETELLLNKDSAYRIYFEVNLSFDYNHAYPEKSAGVNGQPSLVYSADFTGDFKGILDLEPLGCGGVDSALEEPVPDMRGLTSALDIVKRVRVILD